MPPDKSSEMQQEAELSSYVDSISFQTRQIDRQILQYSQFPVAGWYAKNSFSHIDLRIHWLFHQRLIQKIIYNFRIIIQKVYIIIRIRGLSYFYQN